MELNKIYEGCRVSFYDSDRANKDRDYSGNQKYYSIGVIIKERITRHGEDVVDIQLPDGRISYGHFVNGVKLAGNGK